MSNQQYRDKDYRTNLIAACKKGDLELVKDCLSKIDLLYFVMSDALYAAGVNGNRQIIASIVNKGSCYIFDQSHLYVHERWRALMKGARDGNHNELLADLELLCLNSTQLQKNNKLERAIIDGDLNTVRIESKAYVQFNDYKNILECACCYDKSEIVKFLLNERISPLFEKRNQARDRLLLDKKILNGSDHNYFETCINDACKNGNIEILDAILKFCDWFGISGIFTYGFLRPVCRRNLKNKQEILNFFIQNGASDWCEGFRGACENGNFRLCKFMLDRIEPQFVHSQSIFGIIDAMLNGHIHLVQFLYERDPTCFQPMFFPPYFYENIEKGDHQGYAGVMEFLMERGLKGSKQSVLYFASNFGNLQVIKRMMALGAKFDESHFMSAYIRRKYNVVVYFMKRGYKINPLYNKLPKKTPKHVHCFENAHCTYAIMRNFCCDDISQRFMIRFIDKY